ncbi:Dynein heavy chain 5, axonemal [Mizuhopecten yessoensis]|uniref:Dynein heavy chain 5, axonemal n=1 Tax=Mizuhopecten yessoensis TaxID=6573 RepID=A0A210PM49_MIZYE|nr:Dynein heavy chain 5, axonemal [Mizuhopecten yessoensis]
MDERHWWIAGKIQETFKIGGYDNPTLLEDFMTEEGTLTKINRFLKSSGPCRLFFYSEKPENATLSSRELYVTGTLAALKDVNLDNVNILYFLRNRVDKDVDGHRMERDVFCGELKHNTIETLTALLSDVYLPLIKAQKEWGECNNECQTNLTHSMDKFLTALNESTASMQTSKQLMLKQPENIILNDFKQQRAAALDPQLISQYEELVNDWMNTIETTLNDTSDERFLDPNAGPLSELERWRRRQRLLTNITEQLKSKECKAVIGVLITVKSRLLKKWKNIDASITDAMNDTKDKVKYLESLRRHFDQLYHDATPASIINNAIPGITNSVRQMDSISRYYARVGFLGLMFTKITNQLVLACKEYIKNCTMTVYDGDELWERIGEEIRSRDSLPSMDTQHKYLKNQVEANLKNAPSRGKSKEGKDLGLQDDSLFGRLRACLTLQGYYREMLRSLKDALGQSQNLSHFPSLSSVGGPGSFTGTGAKSKQGTSGASRGTSVSPKKGQSIMIADTQGHGVSIADEEAIMSHMDSFCNRIRQLMDVINTLAQYNKMVHSTTGIPRLRKEDLVNEDENEKDIYKYRKRQQEALKAVMVYEDEEVEGGLTSVQVTSPERSLRAIAEDEENQDDQGSDPEDMAIEKKEVPPDPTDDVFETVNGKQGLSDEEIAIIRKYFPEEEEEEGPSISYTVAQHHDSMMKAMSENVTTKTMLDVESKDRDKFDDYYANFATTVQELETFMAAYLHAMFLRKKMKTTQGLDIITRFGPIQSRPGIRAHIAEKFVEIFNWYETDLEEVHNIYETHKENPQMVRNAPPVAGAIHWSRQLLKRIEDPMKIFRDNRAINQLGDFGRIVRIYNRLATALVTFESLWFTQWKNRIEQARSGLRATLFVHHPSTDQIVVNADERVLELIHEAKWLTRLGIQIPESAVSIMQQESRFKNYKSHLELVLNEYREVCESIPEPLIKLFTPHMEFVEQQLQAGLTTLAWNSMNIDAFLHQIHSATQKLKGMQQKVHQIMEQDIYDKLDSIRNFYLFDYEEAISRSWPPLEFRDKMLQSIQSRSEILGQYVESVLSSLQRIANTLATKKTYTFTSIHTMAVAKGVATKIKHKSMAQSEKRPLSTTSFQGSDNPSKSKKMAIMMDEMEAMRERQKIEEEENNIAELIAHYRDYVYKAVLQATCKSLATLGESTGCDSEVIRAVSAMSMGSSPRDSPSPRSPTRISREQSAHSCLSSAATDRPLTSMSMLSNMTWTTERTDATTLLQFEVEVHFMIPNIIVEPTLDIAQTAIQDVANAVLEANRNVSWIGPQGLENFYSLIADDENVVEMTSQLSNIINEIDTVVNKHLFHFSYYNFLWKDDLHGNFKEFISADPGMFAIKREVERFLYIEKKVLGIPKMLPVGPISLHTDPIKDALHGFAMAWKIKFASVLHEEAKKKLDAAVLYRSNVRNRLELHVQSLDQLNSALHLLEELWDMENKIDSIYLPIETLYAKLREFELRLPRNEVEEVDQLRDKWQELIELAEQVREILLKERRGAFEQELDKQVKTFVVEVIQFRNAFDAQGPAVPGIPPAEAVSRLQDFQQKYLLYDSKRNTLESVSKLFGIACKPFSELDKTGEELDLLSQLYGLFQKFLRFDARFKDTLWAEVDLEAFFREVEGYWDECLALPSKLKDWDAYHDLKTSLQTYLEVFPLLHSLNAKEIRNRHWLEVMRVTGSSFQLEANVFKLLHLLDIGLIKHKLEIEEICRGASRELELEIKMRVTEEEWNEQVLTFEHYKKRGPMYLDKVSTERLLEQLEDAQALLANMLTSRYIGPLRDEAAGWAEKLKTVAEVLEQWLEVQDVWQYLEAVFSNSIAAKELPQEAKRFARTDKSWTKLMKRDFETRNVLQCCYGGEVPKAVLLKNIHEELEICFKSLMGYLDNKRRAFPRFYYVSDPILLAIMSRPNDLESVRPHLKSLFSSIHDVRLEEANTLDEPTDEVGFGQSRTGVRTPTGSRVRTSSALSPNNNAPHKIDKRLTEIYQRVQQKMAKKETSQSILKTRGKKNVTSKSSMNPSTIAHAPAFMPSEGIVEDSVFRDAVAVSSAEGELVLLQDKVFLTDGVEVWLQKLRESVAKTIKDLNINIIHDCNNGVAMDEWPSKYPAQVCRMGMLYYWTRECDQGIAEIKYDRKALQGTLKKYIASGSKLQTVLSRGAWRTIEEPMLPLHKARLECMISQFLYLRDILDNMCTRKLREPTDFEWRRSIRCYFHPVASDTPTPRESVTGDDSGLDDLAIQDRQEPMIWILDNPYIYGNEFYGTNAGAALTPVTERCFLTMSQALNNYQGSCVSGPVGVGKTETVKGLANTLGQFLSMVQCCPEFDPTALARSIQGTAMDGCWCCFDEAQSLHRKALSVLFDHVEAVLVAMKARHSYATLADGQEISVKKSCAMHMTINRDDPRCNLPVEVRALFRTVSLIKPDFSLILKAKCASMGFRAPTVLGARLKSVSELAKDQLSEHFHHLFGIATWTGVLKRALQKRKYVRDEKTQDRIESKTKDETSRSESQASEAPTKLAGLQNVASSNVKISSVSRKTGTPNPMTAAGKLEHALVAQTILEVISPRLTGRDVKLFKAVLDDVFAGLPEPPSNLSQIQSAKSRGADIDVSLKHKVADKGLVAHDPWMTKCKQLFNISQVHNGVIVAGPPGSGKSTCIQTLVDSLSISGRGTSRQSQGSRATNPAESMHKLIKINPMVVDDEALMFGSLNQNHDWIDGIFTNAVRKANRNLSTTWLCLDGPLNQGWADNFNSILSGDKVLHLKNGDKLFLSDNIILIFETDSLDDASPATIARSGIVYLDKDVLGWKPLADAWIESRTPQEIHVLQRAFQKTLDPIAQFVLQEAKPSLKLSLVGMFKTCLGLLSAMLADNIEIGGELHIERLYLFCLIWTFGGLLNPADRKGFSDLLKTLSTALPDDDRDICVFDYYVDESGEWDPWTSRVQEVIYTDNQDMLGEVFMDSVDTFRTKILMEFASASGLNVLLVGANGSGKTSLIERFMDIQDPQVSVCKRLVFSGASSAKQFQHFIEANIHHRQGFVYGAKESKKLKVFIDDVNLPVPDSHKVQRCNELLRQLLDDKVLCTLQKPFEWKTVEDLSIISAMSMSDHPSVSTRKLSNRLLRHFAVFNLATPSDEGLKNIVHGILEVNMTDGDCQGLEIDLHNNLVKASCEILKAVQSVLRPAPMYGRRHYLFSLKDITVCFQNLKRLPEESLADETMVPVVSLWRHEMQRIIKDRISRTADLNWFDSLLQETIESTWPDFKEPLIENFVTFPTDARMYQRPVTSVGAKNIKIVLQPIDQLRDVHSCLNTHLTRYNEEFGNIPLNIMLSDFIIAHIIRMHRVLSFHHGGNMLLIGAVGSHLATLCKLALHVADVPIHKVDTSKQSNFFDGLRSAVRLCGSEGKILSLMFTARDLEDPVYLDAINSLLISGEYPHLFSNDELEGLLQAIGPAMKREFPNMSVDPMKFFVARVKSNLHFLMCLQPGHTLLSIAASQYPGLLSGCAINWMCDWPQVALLGEASYFITRHQLTEEFEDLRPRPDWLENVTVCLANIHSFVLRDCRQLPWAGDMTGEVTMNQLKIHEKKKEQIKTQSITVPNHPYSKLIMLERIKNRRRMRTEDQSLTSLNNHRCEVVKAKNEVYIGPTTYRRFMECFKYLYNEKAKERTSTVDQLKKVISTMDQTRTDAKVMKKAIKSIMGKFDDAKKNTADLMHKLTHKATNLEKLKAKVGLSTSLDAYLHLTEMETEEEEEDELLQPEDYDDYDKEFDKMREANLKTRQVAAKEEHVVALKYVEECRQNLEYARQQVLHWKSRVDRQCIERLKGFSTPPVLVGSVMEMVMTLIGKRLPSQRLQESRDYHGKDDLSSRMSSSSSSTKVISKKAKKDGDRFDRAQWKAMTLTMMDTTKFVDMMHNVPWEDGLSGDVLRAVESYLSTGKDGQLGVTGEGTLLDHAQDLSFRAQKRTPSPDGSKGITISAAKYASEDCATLVQYTIAIVEYTRLCGPLKTSLERLNELQREIEENERIQREREEEPQEEEKAPTPEPEEEYTEDDLSRLQGEVSALQQVFDQSVVQKHSLEMELNSMNERLKAATEMVESLKSQEQSWRKHVKENDCNELLLGNCMAAAAFLTYCGPANLDTRKRMGEFFMQVCEHHKLPLPRRRLFRNLELVEFLNRRLDIMNLEIERLPITSLMLENACFLMQEESTTAWPLICDPTSRVIDWLQFYKRSKGLVCVRYSEMRSQFENCLADGSPLLVTDCDVIQLSKDKRFRDAIQRCNRFINEKSRFKIFVEDHEVECDPKFRLYLHTTLEPHNVPSHLAAYCSIMFFQQSRLCIEEELLDRFLAKEKSRLEDERTALRQEKKENIVLLEKLEKQMKDNLSSDVRLMNDLQATKKLAELKKQYDETVESHSRVESAENSILKNRELHRPIAQRAAVCFDVCQYMREVNRLYQMSYTQFLSLYDTAISHSDRTVPKVVIEKVTSSAYTTTARGLLERDRSIFALLLAIEVEDSLKKIGRGEREFLISPNYSMVVMTTLGLGQSPDSKIVQAKKPFDWMTEEQFHNLQILAMYFEWFQEMFDRMPKDGRETQWRTLCESDLPENVALPDKMDDHYEQMQRLCVIRAVRSDRLMQASTNFITNVLGKRYYGDIGIDLTSMLRQSTPTIPLILLYSVEVEHVTKLFHDFSNRKQAKTLSLTINDDTSAIERTAKRLIHKGMQEGMWVLLHNAHNSPHLMNNLEAILLEETNPDSTFRLWITSKVDTTALPLRLLQNSIKAVIDTPKVMKDSLIRSFSSFESDILKQSSRPEWPLMLHNLSYLHAALQLRARYGQGGWNNGQDFLNIGINEIQEALSFMITEFKEPLTCVAPDGSQTPRSTSWTGIRYMFSEIIYGSYITDDYDRNSMSSVVDYWISPNAIKKDFDVAKLKYRHPPGFFNTNPRLNNLIQALDGINNHFLDVPEGCHLHHSNIETLLGDEQYVFTRLNKVFDAMPSTETLSHKLFPKPPTPFHGPAKAEISKYSNNPAVFTQGTFATATYSVLKRTKEIELWEVCHTLLTKMPKSYNRDFLLDRVRKMADFPSFNTFIMKEFDQMILLITEIRTTLQTIKNACETNVLGDMMSDHILSAADDLFYGRTPQTWCRMAGSSAPPMNFAVGNWFNDLGNRCLHFERILSQGRDKMPCYWLGAFFNPRGLLALLKQDYIRHYCGDRSGNFEQFVFQTEVTTRDKEHLRDPPPEGMFVYGIHMWGCAWEKTTMELQDTPPRSGFSSLPVVHVNCYPINEKPLLQDPVKAAEVYQCPVYASRLSKREPIMEMDFKREGYPATRWALRGLSCTIRNY